MPKTSDRPAKFFTYFIISILTFWKISDVSSYIRLSSKGFSDLLDLMSSFLERGSSLGREVVKSPKDREILRTVHRSSETVSISNDHPVSQNFNIPYPNHPMMMQPIIDSRMIYQDPAMQNYTAAMPQFQIPFLPMMNTGMEVYQNSLNMGMLTDPNLLMMNANNLMGLDEAQSLALRAALMNGLILVPANINPGQLPMSYTPFIQPGVLSPEIKSPPMSVSQQTPAPASYTEQKSQGSVSQTPNLEGSKISKIESTKQDKLLEEKSSRTESHSLVEEPVDVYYRKGSSTLSSRKKDDEAPPSRTLFCRSVSKKLTVARLQKIFGRHGQVANLDNSHHSSRGILFVTFYDLRDAIMARERLNNQVIEDRRVNSYIIIIILKV